MTASPGGQLRIGDFIRFDGRLHEVIGMDGIVVILINDSGCRLAVKSAALLSDSTFEIVSSHRWRRPLPPAYFASLPAEFRDRALWLESHVSEVLDGVPAGSDPGTAPRPAYDVTRTTLRQRELAKWSELADAGHAIGVRTPGRVLTPNEMYAASLSVAGYVPVPLTAEDYIQLHPSQPRAINSYGIKLDHRVYDCEELNPYRGQPSGVKPSSQAAQEDRQGPPRRRPHGRHRDYIGPPRPPSPTKHGMCRFRCSCRTGGIDRRGDPPTGVRPLTRRPSPGGNPTRRRPRGIPPATHSDTGSLAAIYQ